MRRWIGRFWWGVGWLTAASAGAAAVTALLPGDGAQKPGARPSAAAAAPAPVPDAPMVVARVGRGTYQELGDVLVEDILRSQTTLPSWATPRFTANPIDWPDRFLALAPFRSGY